MNARGALRRSVTIAAAVTLTCTVVAGSAAGTQPTDGQTVDRLAARKAPAPPWAAVVDSGEDYVRSTVVAGRIKREFPTSYVKRWFADGTVLLEDPVNSRAIVWDPVANKAVVEKPISWYGGGDRGGPNSFFAPQDNVTLVEIWSRLKKKKIRMPAAPGNQYRWYHEQGAVRIGDTILVPFFDTAAEAARGDIGNGGADDGAGEMGGLHDLTKDGRAIADDGPEPWIIRDGVLLIRAGRTKIVLRNKHIVRLHLSSDYRRVLGVTRPWASPYGTELRPSNTMRVVELGSAGNILRQVALPGRYGKHPVTIFGLDAVGSRLAVEIAPLCDTAAACKGPFAFRLWEWSAGVWAPVEGTANVRRRWQAPGVMLSWRVPLGFTEPDIGAREREQDGVRLVSIGPSSYQEPQQRYGPVRMTRGGRASDIFPRTEAAPLAPGSLLKP